jgi:ribonuclease P protein component
VAIDKVFETGRVIVGPSFKLIWLRSPEEEAEPVQIVITVPKRNFKRAVDRNKIKRRIREIYRKNKVILYGGVNKGIYLVLMYTGKNIIEYKDAEEKILKLLHRLKQETGA